MLKKIVLLLAFFIATIGSWGQSSNHAPDCLDSLQIMSAFSPNGDSANDVFSVYFPCTPEEFKITIFNRWGEEVYASKSSSFEWDGKNTKGIDLSEGVYFYIVQYTFQSVEKKINGNVTLMR